jgi:hypothetical protein
MRGHPTRGCGEARGQLCQQRTITGTEAKEVGLECRPDDCEVTGEETPSEPESFGGGNEEEDQDEEEGEVIPSPHSSPPEDLPLPGDHFSQQREDLCWCALV